MKEIAAALFKFQQEVGKINKDGKNPVYNSKYATLSNVLEIIKKPLDNCKLVIVQSPTQNSLFTRIVHVESGEYIESEFPLSPSTIVLEKTEAGKKTTTTSQDPQSVAKAITYARRYALVSMLCLDVDDDDDGNAATKTVQPTASEQQAFREQVQGAQKQKMSPAKIPTKGPVREEQLKLITFYLNKLNKLDAGILIKYSVSELKDLTSEQAVEVINNLEKE